MRRLLPLVATMLIAVVVVGTTTLVGGAGSGAESFTVVSTTQHSQEIDVGAAGESPGDFFIETSALWNEAEERVGSDVVKCTLDFGTTAICTVAFRFFGRGQLTGTGVIDFTSQSFSFPVTGGTRDFRDVTGQVRVTFESQERTTLQFHLSGTAA